MSVSSESRCRSREPVFEPPLSVTSGSNHEVRVLGVLEVVDSARCIVPVNGLKLRTLMTVLALDAGRVVGTDRLIDSVYGEKLPMQADGALQTLVSTLRRALRAAVGEGPSIVTQGTGYLLDLAPEHVDALHFGALVAESRKRTQQGAWTDASTLLHEALGLWRGPALADVANSDFATAERVRLEELRLSALEDCIDADLELGRHAECAVDLEHLVVANPLRERLWGQLMIALYRSGRQAEALRAFQHARRQLCDQLGIEPGPDLCRLEAAVLAQDPSLAPPGRAAAVASAGNMTRPLTACLGRESELEAVHALLTRHRLVTLVGPGGTGKTRLAVDVGLSHQGDIEDGAWMVDLAGVSEPEGVVPALRAALVPHAPTAGPPDVGGIAGVAAAIGHRELLIVLDNCEHVIAQAADVAYALLTDCPQLRILATSREALGVAGELLFPVGPLGPEAAIRLFVERANAANPSLRFDEAATTTVARICTRLDGLPLAIELAAARTRALDLTQIASRLRDRFQLLTAGPRTAMPRQRTLRAVIDWSYDLLEPAERLLFERFSVFPGGAGLASIEAVCAGAGIERCDVAELVSRLVDKSLLAVQQGPDGNRYGMLQSLAEYAGERLAVGGEPDVERRKHADWVLALARAAERGAGSIATVSLGELDAEMGNVDAALAWAVAHDASLALELAGRLGWFWFWTGRIELGWTTLSQCLDGSATVADDVRARATAWAGLLGTVMQAPGAGALVESAVVQGRALGDSSSLASVLCIRAALAILQGRIAPALSDLRDAAEGYVHSGDLHGRGMVAMLQGMASSREGRLADAAACYEQSISHFSLAGDHWAAGVSRQRLAEVAECDDPSRTPVAGEPAVPAPGDVPVGFYRALIRAQLCSVRPGPTGVEHAAAGRSSAPSDADPTDAMAVAVADHIRGRVALRQEHLADARTHLEAALNRYRELGRDAAASMCLGDLGRTAASAGDTLAAARCHGESTLTAMRASDSTMVVSALEALAAVLAVAGDSKRAGWALGAADELRDGGARPWDADVDDRDRAETAAARALGREVLDGLRRQGRTMRIEDVLEGLVAEPSGS
jgi:predicted ATPase/DNA-binding SARP family transcriptional activator